MLIIFLELHVYLYIEIGNGTASSFAEFVRTEPCSLPCDLFSMSNNTVFKFYTASSFSHNNSTEKLRFLASFMDR